MELLSNIGHTRLGVLWIILGFGFLIFVHELGHFLAAKWAGIRTEGFAIGMGSGSTISSRVGVGTHVTVGEPARSEDRAVVEFWQGRVSRVELTPK